MLMTSELIDFSPMYSVNVYLLQLVVGERCVGLWLCKSEALAHRGVQVIYSLPQVFTAGLLIFGMCREYTVCDYSKPFLQKPPKKGGGISFVSCQAAQVGNLSCLGMKCSSPCNVINTDLLLILLWS